MPKQLQNIYIKKTTYEKNHYKIVKYWIEDYYYEISQIGTAIGLAWNGLPNPNSTSLKIYSTQLKRVADEFDTQLNWIK